MTDRYHHYESNIDCVDSCLEIIANLDKKLCFDAQYLEHEFIPKLGLNNEGLNEQPTELEPYFGKGLHLWQYPSQLAKVLVWLAYNAHATRQYLEIGSRWGGTFILVSEWLKKIGAPLDISISIDPIQEPPFIRRYREISNRPVHYMKALSTSVEFSNFLNSSRPDCVFIDGDHSMRGVMSDHIKVRNFANIILHHDVSSQSCPDTTLFWQYLKNAEDDFDAFEFVDQYPSVAGRFLGFGILKRKGPGR